MGEDSMLKSGGMFHSRMLLGRVAPVDCATSEGGRSSQPRLEGTWQPSLQLVPGQWVCLDPLL